jgi:hypothetical protein
MSVPALRLRPARASLKTHHQKIKRLSIKYVFCTGLNRRNLLYAGVSLSLVDLLHPDERIPSQLSSDQSSA